MRINPLRSQRFGALLLGAASVLAFAPVGAFPLLWLTLGLLFELLCRTVEQARGARRGALLGGAFGFGFFLAGVSWIHVSLSVFGGMPAPVAGLATLLFCGVLALYPALVGAVFVRFAPAGMLSRAVFFAALWMLAEWLRGWLFTGFPWLAAGYAQAPPSPLAGYAPLFGVYGVSLLTVLLSALGCLWLRRWFAATACPPAHGWRASPALPVLIIGGLLAIGGGLREVRWTEPQGEPMTVALLQGNIPQDLKWRPELFVDSLRIYHHLARAHPARLTVLPETALPAFLERVPGDYLAAMKALALREQGDLLLGVAVGEGGDYMNAAVSLGASPEQRYAKSHLVPFGEFVPAGFGWFMAMARIPMSDFTPGRADQPPLKIAGQRVAVNICYEDAFGEEIARALPEAGLLVNLSNVAWFGDSLAPAQHLQIAQLRALESGRVMLRATNTGMTAIVDVDGRVRSALPPFTRGALTGEVRAHVGSTPYVRWGNVPAVLGAFLLALLLARRRG